MSRVTKAVVGAGLFLVMSGGLLALTGWALGGETHLDAVERLPFLHFGATSISANEYAVEEVGQVSSTNDTMEAFDTIELDVELGDIIVQTGEDYGVDLEWSGRGYQLQCSNQNGVLKVWSTSGAMGMFNHSASAVITVPEGTQLKQVDLHVSLGDMNLYGITAETLTLEASLGDVNLDGVTSSTGDLTLNLGSLTGYDLEITDQLTVENDMGDIILDGTLTGEVVLSCAMGDIECHTTVPLAQFGYELSVDMGEIKVDGKDHRHSAEEKGGPNFIRMESNMGDIDLTFG